MDVLDILLFIQYPVQSCSVVVSSENLTAPQTCDLSDASCVQSLDYDKGAWDATSYALDAKPKSCRTKARAGQHGLLPLCQCRVLHGTLPWHLLTRHTLGIPPAKQIGATLLQSPAPTQHKRFSNSLNHWSFNVSELLAFSKAGRPNPRFVHLINDRRGCIVDLTNLCQLGRQTTDIKRSKHIVHLSLTFFDAMDAGYNSQ